MTQTKERFKIMSAAELDSVNVVPASALSGSAANIAARDLPASIIFPWKRPDVAPYFHKPAEMTVETAQFVAIACRPHSERGEQVLAVYPAGDGGVWVATKTARRAHVWARKEQHTTVTAYDFGGFYVSPDGEVETVNVRHNPISTGAPWSDA